jgi:hypothetical protein
MNELQTHHRMAETLMKILSTMVSFYALVPLISGWSSPGNHFHQSCREGLVTLPLEVRMLACRELGLIQGNSSGQRGQEKKQQWNPLQPVMGWRLPTDRQSDWMWHTKYSADTTIKRKTEWKYCPFLIDQWELKIVKLNTETMYTSLYLTDLNFTSYMIHNFVNMLCI